MSFSWSAAILIAFMSVKSSSSVLYDQHYLHKYRDVRTSGCHYKICLFTFSDAKSIFPLTKSAYKWLLWQFTSYVDMHLRYRINIVWNFYPSNFSETEHFSFLRPQQFKTWGSSKKILSVSFSERYFSSFQNRIMGKRLHHLRDSTA